MAPQTPPRKADTSLRSRKPILRKPARCTTKAQQRKPLSRAEKISVVLERAYADLRARAAVPNLRRAQALDDEATYGEMHESFVSAMLAEYRVGAASSFVDLGSGIGNVVLQAHLETGCAALGCELDETRHAVALQYRTAVTRRRRFAGHLGAGFAKAERLHGRVTLVHGDCFAESATVAEIARADLIFCANLKFSPESIARQETEVLLRMKPGTVFVSLQQIVCGRTSGGRARFLAENGLEEHARMSERGAVNWKDGPIKYWVYKRL